MSSIEIRFINPGQGSKTVQKFIEGARLQQVVASRPHADRLLRQSRNHLLSASKLADSDPEGAYSALYDASRKDVEVFTLTLRESITHSKFRDDVDGTLWVGF